MTTLRKLLGLAIVLVAIGLMIAAGGMAGIFLNLPSLVGVLLLVSGGTLLAFRPGTVGGALAASFSRRAPEDPEDVVRFLAVYDRAHQLAWSAGLLMLLIGIVQMLTTLEDPSQMGMGVAAASVPLLYGVILAEFVIQPLRDTLADTAPASYAAAGAGNARGGRGFMIAGCLFLAFLMLLAFVSHSGRGRYGGQSDAFDHYPVEPAPRP